jgi:hypothetical protein
LWEETKRFGSWQQAKDFLITLQGRYVFRGLGDAQWNLETTLDRTARYRQTESEAVLVESFQRAVPATIHNAPPHDDRFSWLALMRHYGLPSRLLDCTDSPFVAAYFAAEAPPHCDCHFAIWAFDKDALQHSAEAHLRILSHCGTPLTPIEIGRTELFSAVFNNPSRFVALADAKNKSPRQNAQQGLFLCPGDPGYPFWRNLHGIPLTARTLGFMYKVVLPGGARRDVLADLSGKDIGQAQLLPHIEEIEELCTTLQTLLEQSQKKHGHLQWKVAVKPALMKRGLLEVKRVGTLHTPST